MRLYVFFLLGCTNGSKLTCGEKVTDDHGDFVRRRDLQSRFRSPPPLQTATLVIPDPAQHQELPLEVRERLEALAQGIDRPPPPKTKPTTLAPIEQSPPEIVTVVKERVGSQGDAANISPAAETRSANDSTSPRTVSKCSDCPYMNPKATDVVGDTGSEAGEWMRPITSSYPNIGLAMDGCMVMKCSFLRRLEGPSVCWSCGNAVACA